MFTGIVTAIGRIAAADRRGDTVDLTIEARYPDLQAGESIAVNGACLTVVDPRPSSFRVQVVGTTQKRTRLGDLQKGDRVNLERALRVGELLGGHLVQGHVDGIATVIAKANGVIDLQVPGDIAEGTVLHGSITVDGVSLTVNALPKRDVVQISLIPHTIESTTLGTLQTGDRVHVEGDVIGKYVRRFLESRKT